MLSRRRRRCSQVRKRRRQRWLWSVEEGRFGNPYYSYWKKGCCPEEQRQIVYVSVDAAAEKVGVCSGAWTYDEIRKHSLERLSEFPFYVKFGAQLKFCVSESEVRLCQLNEKRKPKRIYCADWIEGSDRDGLPRCDASLEARAHFG